MVFWRWKSDTRKTTRGQRARKLGAYVEALEDRSLPSAMANLTAYRPVTEFINYTQYPIAESRETDVKLGPGIRLNGDDDNANGVRDFSDAAATAAENDLVRVDIAASGDSFSLSWPDELKVWTTSTKTEAVTEGALYLPGQQTWWVEDVAPAASSGAMLSLTVTAGAETARDDVLFHTFKSDVIAIGGNQQSPANVGDPWLGVFTIGLSLYQQGYDVHLFSYDKVASNGQGAAFNEVKSAVLKRDVDQVAIVGYSWGGGSTYQLAAGLKASAALAGQFQLQYTAYIDGIRRGTISAETRLPPGTQYHDNIYQRKDTFVKGNSLAGATNLNVTNTAWGSALIHTTIDDDATVQGIITTNLKSKVTV